LGSWSGKLGELVNIQKIFSLPKDLLTQMEMFKKKIFFFFFFFFFWQYPAHIVFIRI